MVARLMTLHLLLSNPPLTRALSPFSFILTNPNQNQNQKKKKKKPLPPLPFLYTVTGFVCSLAACLLLGRIVLHNWAR